MGEGPFFTTCTVSRIRYDEDRTMFRLDPEPGVIGVTIIGNGDFRAPEQREESIRFAMSNPDIDAILIGFETRCEIDEAIQCVNTALVEAA